MQVRDNCRLRIFLIADETIAIKAFRNILTDLGHEIISFNPTCDLFDNFQKAPQPVDLIIAELKMPMEEIDRMMREIRQLFPETDIIAMTDYALKISSEEFISDSMHTYPNKLFRHADLEILGHNYFPKAVMTSDTYRI
ncbi:MAG: response regulator [Deltaproteobacteria bacterium]|nr:MAG: response regulator [Deltaproteobacteria bacterium]